MKGLVGSPSPKLGSLYWPPETCPDPLWLVSVCDYLILTISNYALAFLVPGDVTVSVETEFGEELGVTFFTYIDQMKVIVQQIANNPVLQSSLIAMWSQEAGCPATGNSITQVLGPLNVSDQGKQKICSMILFLPH